MDILITDFLDDSDDSRPRKQKLTPQRDNNYSRTKNKKNEKKKFVFFFAGGLPSSKSFSLPINPYLLPKCAFFTR